MKNLPDTIIDFLRKELVLSLDFEKMDFKVGLIWIAYALYHLLK